MSKQRSAKQLAKLIDYVLSRRPDEFGLVTDEHGFVKTKELLKAVNEEEGFRYVRRSHLDEILITVPDHSLEVADKFIRSKFRDRRTGPWQSWLAVAFPQIADGGTHGPAFPGRGSGPA